MKTSCLNADEIVELIQKAIVEWHEAPSIYPSDGIDLQSKDMSQLVKGIALINTEAWHEEDKIHSGDNNIIVKAVRRANVLNQTRNKFVEGLDELFVLCVESIGKAER